MPTSLSFDLRVRVLAAVARGLSYRAVGERFGVSASSVSRWRALEREQGEARPANGRRSQVGPHRGAQGHDTRHSGGDAGHCDRGIARRASREGPGFRLRHDPPLLRPPRHHAQKRLCTPANRIGRTSSGAARPGSRSSSISIPSVSSSSMRPGPQPTWPERTAVAAAANGCASASPAATGKRRLSSPA
jgi:hypothetical protein